MRIFGLAMLGYGVAVASAAMSNPGPDPGYSVLGGALIVLGAVLAGRYYS